MLGIIMLIIYLLHGLLSLFDDWQSRAAVR